MKKLIIGVFLIISSFSAQAAVTIKDLTLFNSENPGQIWVTWTTGHWILGVSDLAHGPLLNAPDASVEGIPQGNYWLFADPAGLGTFPELDVTLSDGSTMSAIFEVSGSNGTAQSWTRISGSPLLSLGWADGSADLVGTYAGISPDGVNDFYMYATIGAVPEPSQYIMLLLGFIIVGSFTKRHYKFS
ncbi:MAG: PEP-CTERM sorting domain-containing protein [Gammaproteobacteria bacterium]|nr:MAG: PEP-CTERM sorting domain-containing protein [Gammaproteobacteria bacterium]